MNTETPKVIPIHILRNCIGWPCIFKDLNGNPKIGIIEAVRLKRFKEKRYDVYVTFYNAENDVWDFLYFDPSEVTPILKNIDDLNEAQVFKFFQYWFENLTGLEEGGANVYCEVLEVKKLDTAKWEVTTKNTIKHETDNEFIPLEDIQTESWEIKPGAMDYINVMAFGYLVECGVDAYGLQQENLAEHIGKFPDLVSIDGYMLPIECIGSLGYDKSEIAF